MTRSIGQACGRSSRQWQLWPSLEQKQPSHVRMALAKLAICKAFISFEQILSTDTLIHEIYLPDVAILAWTRDGLKATCILLQ